MQVRFPDVAKDGVGRPDLQYKSSNVTWISNAVTTRGTYGGGPSGKGYSVSLVFDMEPGALIVFRWVGLDSASDPVVVNLLASDDLVDALGLVDNPREVPDAPGDDNPPEVSTGGAFGTMTWRGQSSVSDRLGLNQVVGLLPQGISYDASSGTVTNVSAVDVGMVFANLYVDGSGTWGVSAGGDGDLSFNGKRAVYCFSLGLGESFTASFGTNQVPYDCYSALSFCNTSFSARYGVDGTLG